MYERLNSEQQNPIQEANRTLVIKIIEFPFLQTFGIFEPYIRSTKSLVHDHG